MLTNEADHPDKEPGSTEVRNRKLADGLESNQPTPEGILPTRAPQKGFVRLGETRIIKQALALRKMRDAADAGVPLRYVMRKRKR